MPNIVDTLKQDEMWYAQDGMPFRLTDMEPSHRFNVLAFLSRRAKNLMAHRDWQELLGAPDEIIDQWAHQIDEDPQKWLARQPLVQELVRLCRIDGSIDGELVETKEELAQ